MRRLSPYFLHTPLITVGDVALVNACFLLAFLLREGRLATLQDNLAAYLFTAPWISIASVMLFYSSDLYTNWYRRTRDHILCSVFFATLLIPVVAMAVTFWERRFAFPRSVLVISFLLQFVLISVFRLAVQNIHRRAIGQRSVLIVGGSEKSALSLANAFMNANTEWYWVVGFLPASRLDLLESRLIGVDAVLLSEALPKRGSVMARCAKLGKEVLMMPGICELSLLGADMHEIDDTLVLSTRSPHMDPFKAAVKRLFDLAGALAIAAVSSPVLLVLYVLVPLTSKGPALFKQERVGLNGHRYEILKFRTMVADAEIRTGPVLASKADPRVTKLGKFLRATRLDELPQVWNVFSGEMSLVGPRPERAYFVEQFRREIPAYDLRYVVKPGITGLAQALGKYSTSAENKLRFDLMYAFNYSLALDLRILVQTVRVVLQGHVGESRMRTISVPNLASAVPIAWPAEVAVDAASSMRNEDAPSVSAA